MSARAVAACAAAGLALALAAAPCHAHPLDIGTARVSLRDDHVEVLAELDLFTLADAGPTTLATEPEGELTARVARLRQALEAGTVLEVDGRRALLVATCPSTGEVRAAAATLSSQGKEHGELLRVRFEARDAFREPRRVALGLPPALGPVLVTFVQPASRYAAPGSVATFDVRIAPGEAVPAAPVAAREPATTTPAWPALLLVAAGCAAALVSQVRSRRIPAP